jgi:hypothetical protein
MEDSTAVNIVFMAIRGLISLAIVGVAFYCLKQGIQFFMLPHEAAQQIQLEILGSKISASGLGAVIFATGVALAFVGLRAAPRSLTTSRTTKPGRGPSAAPIPPQESPLQGSGTQGAGPWNEYTVATTAVRDAPLTAAPQASAKPLLVTPEMSSQLSKYSTVKGAQAPPPQP